MVRAASRWVSQTGDRGDGLVVANPGVEQRVHDTHEKVGEDDEDDHDHFDFSEAGAGEDIEGIEMFTLNSVGIDIGSSTTHTIFSRPILRREGAGISAKFVVTSREVL